MARQHQFVIAFVVGKGGQPERLRGKQLRVRASHPRRRRSPLFGVEVDSERGQEVRCGALRGVGVHRPLRDAHVRHTLPVVRIPSRAHDGVHVHSGTVTGCQQC